MSKASKARKPNARRDTRSDHPVGSPMFAKLLAWGAGLAGVLCATFISGVLSNVFPRLQLPISSAINHAVCSISNRGTHIDAALPYVLIAPLQGDDDGSQTKRLQEIFLGTNVEAFRICESVAFDFRNGTAAAEKQVKARASEILSAQGGDVLIFGEQLKKDESLHLWFVNGIGECDAHPTTVTLEHGALDDKVRQDAVARVLPAAVAELAAGCDHGANFDWALFGKRVTRVGGFLESRGNALPAEQRSQVESAYSDALGLLYKYQGDETWFLKSKRLFEQMREQRALDPGADRYAYASLFVVRWRKTKDHRDLTEAKKAFGEAEELNPNSTLFRSDYGDFLVEIGDCKGAVTEFFEVIRRAPTLDVLLQRGRCSLELKDWSAATADFDSALKLPMPTPAFRASVLYNRAVALASEGEVARARSDVETADQIGTGGYGLQFATYLDEGLRKSEEAVRVLDALVQQAGGPDKRYQAQLLNARCWINIKLRKASAARADCDRALDLAPQLASALDSRGFVHLNAKEYADAISDFTAALRFDKNISSSLYGRAMAEKSLGLPSAKRDLQSARSMSPDIETTLKASGIVHEGS